MRRQGGSEAAPGHEHRRRKRTQTAVQQRCGHASQRLLWNGFIMALEETCYTVLAAFSLFFPTLSEAWTFARRFLCYRSIQQSGKGSRTPAVSRADSRSEARAEAVGVGSSALILIEAPSTAYH